MLNLDKTNKDYRRDLSSLKTTNDAQENEIISMKATINNQDREIANLRNVQTGVIDCGGSYGYGGHLDNYWGQSTYDTFKTKTVNFQQNYIRSPEVHLSFAFVDGHPNNPTYFRTELVSVNTSSFTMRCRGLYNAPPDYMLVSWVSIPQ